MKILTFSALIGAAAMSASVLTPSASAATTGFLMTAPTVEALADDDERAAAEWFLTQPDTRLVQVSELATLDVSECPVLWIMADRTGIDAGWRNLPAEITSDEAIEAIRDYNARGGSLYLSNMATQLTVPLGIVPEEMAPTVFGSGEGGEGNDVWTINPVLGIIFGENGPNAGEQGYYDRRDHVYYSGMELADPNGWGFETLPLIGPGHREDHNCIWDCNIYGKGESADVIANFELTTGSTVAATWGHVQDHCVAGLVEFARTDSRGACAANGFAAYEWYQNSGENPYRRNIEKLTQNILSSLKDSALTGIKGITGETADTAEAYYTLQGVRTADPKGGIFIRVSGGKAEKVVR